MIAELSPSQCTVSTYFPPGKIKISAALSFDRVNFVIHQSAQIFTTIKKENFVIQHTTIKKENFAIQHRKLCNST